MPLARASLAAPLDAEPHGSRALRSYTRSGSCLREARAHRREHMIDVVSPQGLDADFIAAHKDDEVVGRADDPPVRRAPGAAAAAPARSAHGSAANRGPSTCSSSTDKAMWPSAETGCLLAACQSRRLPGRGLNGADGQTLDRERHRLVDTQVREDSPPLPHPRDPGRPACYHHCRLIPDEPRQALDRIHRHDRAHKFESRHPRIFDVKLRREIGRCFPDGPRRWSRRSGYVPSGIRAGCRRAGWRAGGVRRCARSRGRAGRRRTCGRRARP